MALVSFPTITTNNKIGGFSHSLLFTSQAITTLENCFSHRNSNNKSYVIRYYYSPLLYQSSNHHRKFSPKRTGLFLVPVNANKNSEPESEDFQALETVLRLYTAIKNKNIRELSDVIADECQCVCNFFSSFQPFQGKKVILNVHDSLISYFKKKKYTKLRLIVSLRMFAVNLLQQVLDCFSYIIRSLGNNIEFVVTPIMHDGMNVGIKWRLGM